MKRFGIGLLCALLLSALLIGSVMAEDADHTKNPLAIDMVIVIQNNTQMVKINNNPGFDKSGLRFDAAASLISMCDVKYSRACYFMFADNLFIYQDQHTGDMSGNTETIAAENLTLLDISIERHRGERLKLIQELTGESNGDKIFNEHTTRASKKPDIISAFEAAVEVQTRASEQTGNRKIIVILTAGNQGEGEQEFTEQARAAKQKADENGVEVYAVSLNVWNRSLLQNLVTKPDNAQQARTPIELLRVFRNFFADMIGSEPQKADIVNNGKTSDIKVQIPNESVREVNIILPLKQVDNPVLKDPAGEEIIIDISDDVMKSQGKNFINYKLINPNPGLYTLTYEAAAQDRDSIDVQYVYSYDVNLSAKTLVNGGQTDTMSKGDTLKIEAYFTDENGRPSTDSTLYEQKEDERWNINGYWELYEVQADGTLSERPVHASELMTPDPANRMFTADVSLREAGVERSGNYMLVLTAKGAGMNRSNRIPLTILNREPSTPRAGLEYQITVNRTSGDPNRQSWKKVTNVPLATDAQGNGVSLKDLFADPDGDKLTFRLEGSNDQAATIKLDLGDILTYTTKEENGKVRAGTVEYILHYTDGDPRTSEDLTVPVKLVIRSEVDKELEAYVPEMTVTGDKPTGGDGNSFRKNSAVTISLRLKNREGSGYAGRAEVEKYLDESSIQISDTSGNNTVSDGKFTLSEEGDALVYTIASTGNNQAEWDITAKIGLFEDATDRVLIPNSSAPKVEKTGKIEYNINGTKVPGFLRSFIGKDTDAENENGKIHPDELFSDADGDVLEYFAPEFISGSGKNEVPVGYIGIKPEAAGGRLEGDKNYQIVVKAEEVPGAPFSYTFTSRVRIKARDGDGQEGILEREITVVDLYSKMLTYIILLLAAIAALVILILIIHQIRKPVFPKLNMTIREEPSLYESGSEPLSPVKKPTNVNAIGVDGDMAAKHSISMELLQNIIVKPIRSRMGVGVVCRKMVGGHEVSLDDVRMKVKKLYTWNVGQDLSIRNVNGDGFITIKLEDRSDEEGTDFTNDEFGEGSDWETDDGTTENNAGKRRSRRISRKAAPQEDENKNSSGGDDFDF